MQHGKNFFLEFNFIRCFMSVFNWTIISISLSLLKWYTTIKTVCVAEVIFNVLYLQTYSKQVSMTIFAKTSV